MNATESENLFESKLAKNEMIEPKDWMPENYRKHLIRQISQHAHSEIVGMWPKVNGISKGTKPKSETGFTGESTGMRAATVFTCILQQNHWESVATKCSMHC